ncbi:hypothetical protein OTK49_01340 [Vibrio coralliirubri]|uniref:hypothetical protein n=1 Tax=Vibrio coralliirubri TaxID=1516159 RepID=UPI002284AEFA|nr:hypothetical protein [Vibrio coralliirubri]MCY9861173.1 hypothetical protein [Vibrio coralliirubri]
MNKVIHALICLVAVAIGLAVAVPVLQHKAQKNEEHSLARQAEAMNNLRNQMLVTLNPSLENKRWMRVNKSQYDKLRNYRGYVIDMDDNLGASTITIREAIKTQVETNIKAIDNLLFSTNLYNKNRGFKRRAFEIVNENYNIESDSLSPEVQLMAQNIAGGADALMKGETIYNINPRYFLYDSKGKLNSFEERQFTYEYHKMYKEYWIDYFLDDDAHIYRSKYDKIEYQYIF